MDLHDRWFQCLIAMSWYGLSCRSNGPGDALIVALDVANRANLTTLRRRGRFLYQASYRDVASVEHDAKNERSLLLQMARTSYSYLVEVRFGLHLTGSLVPLKVLHEIVRDGVLGAPPEQTLCLSETEDKRVLPGQRTTHPTQVNQQSEPRDCCSKKSN